MGKGDKRSRKGKIWRGSYGNSRKRKKKNEANVPSAKKAGSADKAKKAPAKKAAAKKKAEPKKSEE